MFNSFCKSPLSILIMLLSILLLVIYQSFYTQMFVLLVVIGFISLKLFRPPILLMIGVFILLGFY